MTEIKKYIASDHHFFHKKIMQYSPWCRGGFKDVHEMNDEIIKRHNSVVGVEDEVWFVGDFAFCGSTKALSILERMNGTKHYVSGNHDGVMKSERFRNHFATTQKYKELRYNGNMIVLFHFPIMHWNLEDNGSVHFFGHLHNEHPKTYGRAQEVCIDGNDLYPYNMDDLYNKVMEREIIGRTRTHPSETQAEAMRLHGIFEE